MESEKYLEGQSMQRPPLFESDEFIYWKNRFETYVKSKDLDLWHVITYGDFPPIQNNPETKKDEIVPFDKQNDDLKKKLAKNNEAKMVIYNALPRKEYERIFMCKTAKEIGILFIISTLVDKYTAEGDIEVFSTKNHGLDWISTHNFLTHLQKLSSYASSHLKVSKLAACLDKASFSLHFMSCHNVFRNMLLFSSQIPPKLDTPKTDLINAIVFKVLLSLFGYSVGRDDIINIISLRKHSSCFEFDFIPEVHTLSLL
ncbi:hypothetical protein Tco_1285963 [Tanacetum coccineum]